jgi:probable HAF family extracellular repeat protein
MLALMVVIAAVVVAAIRGWSTGPGQGPPSLAVAINDRGQIVGNESDRETGATRALLWENGKVTTTLQPLPGDEWTEATDINNAGQIVGWSYVTTPQGFEVPAAVLWEAGTVTPLGTLSGGLWSKAMAISDDGRIAGSSGQNQTESHAVMWHNGQIAELATVPGSTHSEAHAINDAGQVAGSAWTGSALVGVVWENGTATNLGAMSGDESNALGINAAGETVGWAGSSGGGHRAVRWREGMPVPLDPLPGGRSSEALGINDAGQIVGWAQTADGASHAALWVHGTPRDLGSRHGDKGSEAIAINTAGQVVGASGSADGTSRAVSWRDGTITDLPSTGKDASAPRGDPDRGIGLAYLVVSERRRRSSTGRPARRSPYGSLG